MASGLEGGLSEIDIIESALREARLRLPATASGSQSQASSPRRADTTAAGQSDTSYSDVDAAKVEAYGAQLKSWVDMQVDSRLNLVLAERDQEKSAAEQGVSAEVEAVKAMQASLFAVVEGLSQEFTRMKAQMPETADNLSRDLARTQVAVSEEIEGLKTSIAIDRIEGSKAAREVDFDESKLWRRLQDSHNRLSEDLTGLLRRLTDDLRRETVGALQRESEAIVRLDKRLRLLDQRFERRFTDSGPHPSEELLLESPYRIQSPCSQTLSGQSPRDETGAKWNIIGGRLVSEKLSETSRLSYIRQPATVLSRDFRGPVLRAKSRDT